MKSNLEASDSRKMDSLFINDTFPGYYFYTYANCTDAAYWHLKESWFWFLVIATVSTNGVLVVMGVVLNVLSYRILTRQKDNVMNVILRFVAVIDILVLLVNAVDNVCHVLENFTFKDKDIIFFFAYFHTLLWIPQSSFLTIRNWCMIYMSFSRLFSVAFPFRGPKVFNVRNSKIVLNLLWLIILPCTFPKFLEINALFAYCKTGWRMSFGGSGYLPVAYSWFTSIVINSVVPLILCILLNSMLLHSVNKSNKFRQQATSVDAEASKQNKSTTKTVLTLSCMFIICQVPMLVYGVIVFSPIPKWLFNYINLCGTMINGVDSSCNFFIYIGTNPRFRKDLTLIWPWTNRFFKDKSQTKSNASETQLSKM